MERHVETSQTVRASVDMVERVLGGPDGVLGERCPRTEAGPTTYLSDVEVGLGGGASVREQVRIRCLRRFDGATDGDRWDLSWEPLGRRRLLPAFTGRLEASPHAGGARLHLTGSYRPPLGAAGAAGDTLIGHRIAEHTLGVFLAGLAERIDREVDARRERYGVTSTLRPEHLRNRRSDARDLPGARP